MVFAGAVYVKRLILASSSPWRLAALRDAGIPCETVPPAVDEHTIINEDPVAMAVARAEAKALDVARRWPDALVVGADQVAHLAGESFGKPRDTDDWRARLRSLRGRVHLLSTGVALAEGEAVETFTVTTAVRFRADLSDEEIEAYIRSGEGAGCAGGYQVERRGAWLIEAIDGDWWNVIGLPILPLIGRLRARGWRLEGAGEVGVVVGDPQPG